MSVKTSVLQLLESNRDRYVSGTQLAAELKVSRNAVWKAIAQLQEEGYPIRSQARLGYCLPADTDILSAQSLRKYWGEDCPFSFQVYPEVTSTNTLAKEAAATGAPEGLVILARHQSAGRGRLSRSFYSPADTGLYMTILLRPQIPVQDCLLITTAMAVAAAEAIEEISGQTTAIKWVNDVFCRGHKVCGILTEASLDIESGFPEYVISGIGINLQAPEGGFPEELKQVAGAVFPTKPPADTTSRLAASLLKKFRNSYLHLQEKPFLAAYRQRNLVIGRAVNILKVGQDPIPATVLAIEDDFSLRVRLSNGDVTTLSTGEVSIRLSEPDAVSLSDPTSHRHENLS
jgi:BirA family biotin operon repressor/biotin-[acetyl-CoA-carboxylase] ligase